MKSFTIKNSKPQGISQVMRSCGRNLQSIKHSNLQLEAGAYNRRKKNWHFKREGAIGFAALLWKSGASLKCSIKTKGRTAVKKFSFFPTQWGKIVFCTIFIFQWLSFFWNIYINANLFKETIIFVFLIKNVSLHYMLLYGRFFFILKSCNISKTVM